MFLMVVILLVLRLSIPSFERLWQTFITNCIIDGDFRTHRYLSAGEQRAQVDFGLKAQLIQS